MCFILLMRHLLIAVPPQYLHQVREDCLWCLLPCSDPGSTWVESRDICKMKMNSRIWKHLDWRYCIVSLLYSSAQTTIICIEREREKGWAPKNWHFWTMVLEKTLENPWDGKEIKPVNPKGNQPWIFTEGVMLKVKFQYFGHLMQRTNSLEKTLMLKNIDGKRRRVQQRMR